MAYPKDGVLTCRKCEWTGKKPKSQIVSSAAEGKERVVLEEEVDPRAQQEVDCPKCGHGKAYFHLMQTRRSDEPPTEINECIECSHSWREY
jgi:DNA-directed RNA polymerase subunit M